MDDYTVPGEIATHSLPKYSRDDLVFMMREELRREFIVVEARIKADERRYIISEHQLGATIAHMQDHKAEYGSRPLEVMAAAACVDVARFNRAVRFFRLFPDREAVFELTNRRGDKGYRFTYSHVLQLLVVEEAPLRARLIEEAFFDRLTVRQLLARIRKILTNGRWRRRQKKPLPRGVQGGLLNLKSFANRLCDQVETVLPTCILGPLAKSSVDPVDLKTREQIAGLRDEYEEVAKTAASAAQQLAELTQRLEDQAPPAPASKPSGEIPERVPGFLRRQNPRPPQA